VDKSLFRAWLSEVAVVREEKVARDPVGSRQADAEPITELVIDHTLPKTKPCAYCDKTCTGCLSHSYTLDRKTYKKTWVTQCDTCRKKIDLKTGKIITPPPVGVNYVNQNLRQAQPGNRLGRPRKDFWNEPVRIYTEEEAREQSLKHAGMLDRLAQLRNK
jgi:hypothetical protein